MYEHFAPFIDRSLPDPGIIYESESEEFTSDTDPGVQVNFDEKVLMTTVTNLKAAIASRTGYHGEIQFSKFLKKIHGLIILPLSAITVLRFPTGAHKSDPMSILYIPSDANDQTYPNFQEADNWLFVNNNPEFVNNAQQKHVMFTTSCPQHEAVSD